MALDCNNCKKHMGTATDHCMVFQALPPISDCGEFVHVIVGDVHNITPMPVGPFSLLNRTSSQPKA